MTTTHGKRPTTRLRGHVHPGATGRLWRGPALLLMVAIGTTPSTASVQDRIDAPPSLAECKTRIADRADGIDSDCLRRVYAQPIEDWPAPHLSAGAHWQEFAPLPAPPEPAGNPSTPAKIALGQRLFEDPGLSRSAQIACTSCHDRQLGWGDGRSVSFGHDRQPGQRNAPGIPMAAYATSLFWDGRASSLEEQALGPIQDPKEMAFQLPELERRLNREQDYRSAFAQAFGAPEVTAVRVAQALAAYERSLAPRNNRFDRFLAGQRDELDDRQLWGLHLFRTRGRCMNCHSGPALSDQRFHNLGLHYYGRRYEDLGRYEVTGDAADAGTFRTPSLRMVSRTGPWMHNGLFPDLRGVVAMYVAGMPRPRPQGAQASDPRFPGPDPLLQPLDLTANEVEAMTEFLRAL
ncbi:cytochrome-c peroxidase [Dyella sp. C9]|uniref:cytochrome-c peroxidase n=1 Tax=Dyella sp. C9 TaxID=2202154 RepID=UPI0018E57E47|nr:cytochrome c peroxidase [Dyella sp. C9]